MPKARVYVQVNFRLNAIFVRRFLDDVILKEFINNQEKFVAASLFAFHYNNSKEGDNITLRLIDHLKKTDQEHKIPENFYPQKEQIVTEVRYVGN